MKHCVSQVLCHGSPEPGSVWGWVQHLSLPLVTQWCPVVSLLMWLPCAEQPNDSLSELKCSGLPLAASVLTKYKFLAPRIKGEGGK